jgi:hypothetical protein
VRILILCNLAARDPAARQGSRAAFVPVGLPLGPVEATETGQFGALAKPTPRQPIMAFRELKKELRHD